MSQQKVERKVISEEEQEAEVQSILSLPDAFKPDPTHEIVGVLLPYKTLMKARQKAKEMGIKLHEYIEQLIEQA